MKSPIPEAALKKHIAILGMNGSGKTSVAKSQIIEPALEAGERVCNIDPTGVGWGLRLSKTGKSKGFSIYIVGGEHADFPLVMRDGKTWGEIVGTSSDSFVFDTSAMTVGDRGQWFTDFAETLLRKNKGPLKFVLDEAHLFAPQGGATGGGIAPRMLHATNNLLALGRSKGLRITMISQRPAKLHKDSLTQAHTMIAMMMTAPQDRAAVKTWIDDQADAETGKEIIASLPTLAPGEGWIWAPREHLLQRVKFAMPATFDSSSAPDDDTTGPALAPIDPATITGMLKQVAEKEAAKDPARLQAEIARLQATVAALESRPAAKPDTAALDRERLRGWQQGRAGALSQVRDLSEQLRVGFEDWIDGLIKSPPQPPLESPPETAKAMPKVTSRLIGERHNIPIREVDRLPSSSPKGERKMLHALASYPNGLGRNQLTTITGYKRSTRDRYIQFLQSRELVLASTSGIVAAEELFA